MTYSELMQKELQSLVDDNKRLRSVIQSARFAAYSPDGGAACPWCDVPRYNKEQAKEHNLPYPVPHYFDCKAFDDKGDVK